MGASPTEGSSTKRIFGADMRARVMASICCSPTHTPRKLAASLVQDWEGLETETQIVRHGLAGLCAVGTEQQVLFNGEFWKQPTSLGYKRNAQVHNGLGGLAAQIDTLAVDFHKYLAGIHRHQTHDALHQCAFAIAIGPQ